MPPRVRMPVDPGQARELAKAAASRKAERTPHRLTESEAMLIPPKQLLELGNAGHLQHLGIGLPTKKVAPAKGAAKKAAPRSTGKTQARKGRS